MASVKGHTQARMVSIWFIVLKLSFDSQSISATGEATATRVECQERVQAESAVEAVKADIARTVAVQSWQHYPRYALT